MYQLSPKIHILPAWRVTYHRDHDAQTSHMCSSCFCQDLCFSSVWHALSDTPIDKRISLLLWMENIVPTWTITIKHLSSCLIDPEHALVAKSNTPRLVATMMKQTEVLAEDKRHRTTESSKTQCFTSCLIDDTWLNCIMEVSFCINISEILYGYGCKPFWHFWMCPVLGFHQKADWRAVFSTKLWVIGS